MLTKLRKRCIYMCGDLGLQTITNFANIYLMIYLTDILGISPLAAGTMYAVARVWDAINDPLMGSIADRTRTRWGSYRPWFLFGALPLCAVFVLLFTVPNFSPSGKLVWAYVVYIAYGMLMTMVSIPYGALPNVLTTDSQERSILGIFRTYGSNISQLMVSALAVPLFTILGNDPNGNAAGYQGAAFVFALITFVLCLIMFFFSREVIPVPQTKTDFKASFRSFLHNGPAICLLVICFFNIANISTRMGLIPYWTKHYLQNAALQGPFLTFHSTVMLFIPATVPFLTRFIGKKYTLMLSGTFAVACGIVTFLAGHNIALCYVAMFLGACAASTCGPVVFGTIPDAADYGEWKTGVRCPGVIASGTTFGMKLASGIGGLFMGIILSLVGYNGDLEVQTAQAQQGILLLTTFVPVVFGALVALTASRFKLDPKTTAQVSRELAERRAAQLAEEQN